MADRLKDLWNDAHAATLSEAQQLLYRSNLLGSDRRITNYGGGNTSAKVEETDPLSGQKVRILYVKGSGGDLGSAKMDGFSTLYIDKLESLKTVYRGKAHEDEMPAFLPHCFFNLNTRATSIDTPPHCFIPHRHVDHMHCDAIIALAAAKNGERLTRECFSGRVGWIPWQRPGFDLGLKVGAMTSENPKLEGLVLGSHGLVNWGKTSKESYQTTLRLIQEAADWLDAKSRPEPFGPLTAKPLPEDERKALLAETAPILRGLLSTRTARVMHHVETAEVLDFVGRARCAELADRGTTCPDHFLRTKVKPLFVPFDPPKEKAEDLLARLPALVETYRQDYEAYYERCKRPDSPQMRDPYPVLVLIPGLGMLSFHRDKATARYASEYYVQTIHVMRWAEGVDTYAPISEQDAFDIEYWILEDKKLQLLPKPRSLDGRVALITGGAGGIGSATARRLLAEGANVVLLDIDPAAANEACAAMQKDFGADCVRAVTGNVTDEAQVRDAFLAATLEYGGVDILVSNAGIASASPVETTTLVSREALRLLKRQGRGGSIVFVGSNIGLVASAGASAYRTVTAAERHLARGLALEGAEAGIRVNLVNPVARSVFPEDIAEAVCFLASDLSAKSTGNILNVDAGKLTALPLEPAD